MNEIIGSYAQVKIAPLVWVSIAIFLGIALLTIFLLQQIRHGSKAGHSRYPVMLPIMISFLVLGNLLISLVTFQADIPIRFPLTSFLLSCAAALVIGFATAWTVLRRDLRHSKPIAGALYLGLHIPFVLAGSVSAHPVPVGDVNWLLIVGATFGFAAIGALTYGPLLVETHPRRNLAGLVLFLVLGNLAAASPSIMLGYPVDRIVLTASDIAASDWWTAMLTLLSTIVLAMALTVAFGNNPRKHWRRYAVACVLVATLAITMNLATSRSVRIANTHFELARLMESVQASRADLYLVARDSLSRQSASTGLPDGLFRDLQRYYEDTQRIDRLMSDKDVAPHLRALYSEPYGQDSDRTMSIQSNMPQFYVSLKASFGLQSGVSELDAIDQARFTQKLSELSAAALADARQAFSQQVMVKDAALIGGLLIVAFMMFGVFMPAHRSTVTALDTLERERAKSKKLALSAEHTTKGIVLAGVDARIIWCNHAFEQITGWNEASILGCTVVEILTGEVTEKKAIAKIYEDLFDLRSSDFEIEVYRRGGGTFWISGTVTPIVEDGEVTQIVHVINDITEERAMRLSLETARAEAERLALIARNASELDGLAGRRR